MNFTIDRSKWRCGGEGPNKRGLGGTFLLNETGFMCCLGHVAGQLEASPDSLIGVGDPCSVKGKDLGILVEYEKRWECERTCNSILAGRAIAINDNETYCDNDREQALQTLFQAYGHTLTFTGSF